MTKQIHRSGLPAGQTEAEKLERRVRAAFVNAPSALPCRPEPRAAFDNAARADMSRAPWRAFGLPLRGTCDAARAIGGPAVDETRERVLSSILALAAWVLEPLDGGASIEDMLYTRVIREQSEAIEAQSIDRGLRTETSADFAVEQSDEAIVASQLYVATLKRRRDAAASRWASTRQPIPFASHRS